MTSKIPDQYDARVINQQYQCNILILSLIAEPARLMSFNEICTILSLSFPEPNKYQQELVSAYTSRFSSEKVVRYHASTGWINTDRVQINAVYDPMIKPVSDANSQSWVDNLIKQANGNKPLTIHFSTYAQYIALRHVNILGHIYMPSIEVKGESHPIADDGMAFEEGWPQDFDVRNIDRMIKMAKGPSEPPEITESTPKFKFVITDGDEEAVGDEAIDAWYLESLKSSLDVIKVATASQFKQLCLGVRFGELQPTTVEFKGSDYKIDAEACVHDRPNGLFDLEFLLVHSEASIIGAIDQSKNPDSK